MRITGNPEYTPQYLLSQIIAIPYNEDYGDEDEPLEGLQIQTLRASMRARRRSSVGSSEESSLADSQIRVDVIILLLHLQYIILLLYINLHYIYYRFVRSKQSIPQKISD